MKELTRIEPEPEVPLINADHRLKYLSAHVNNGLHPEDTDILIRLLIHKVNELTDEVNRIKAGEK